MFERSSRFLTVRLRNASGSKSGSADTLPRLERRCLGRVRRRVEHRHDLRRHLLACREPALLVAPERVLDLVDEALVRVDAWVRWLVVALGPQLHEVVVRDQRAADRDAVAVAALD